MSFNTKELKQLLKDQPKERVKVYADYISALETQKKSNKELVNKWIKYFTPSKAAAIFTKVALDGLFVDGDSILLVYRGGSVREDYNYQAYKNRLLIAYPNTKFDLNLVHKGDKFDFKKIDGKIEYIHQIGDPFKNNRQIIGAYCIIKNKRGEFLETLNMEEIQKMRNVARTQNIWENWEGEMILKSVIKRSCKRHFKDLVTNIEETDKDNYNLDNVNLDSKYQEEIEKAQDVKTLGVIYERYKNKEGIDEEAFLNKLGEKRKEIEEGSTHE
jgi:hypothetical protein